MALNRARCAGAPCASPVVGENVSILETQTSDTRARPAIGRCVQGGRRARRQRTELAFADAKRDSTLTSSSQSIWRSWSACWSVLRGAGQRALTRKASNRAVGAAAHCQVWCRACIRCKQHSSSFSIITSMCPWTRWRASMRRSKGPGAAAICSMTLT